MGKSLVDTLMDLPVVLSPIALGAMLLIFFSTPLGKVLDGSLGPFVFEVKGIIVAQFFVIIGLSIRLLKNTFETVDVEYEHLARTLGYGRFRVFTRVVLPISKKSILAAFLLTWGRAIGEFGATVTLAGATTFKTETLPVAIFLNFESADVSSALAFILILVAVSMVILFSMRKAAVKI
jgi:molybdate transport system permease protein